MNIEKLGELNHVLSFSLASIAHVSFSYFLIFRTCFAVPCSSRSFGNERLFVMRICSGFDLYRTVIGLENVPISQPIRSKSKTTCGSLTHVFPCLAPGTCIFFRF